MRDGGRRTSCAAGHRRGMVDGSGSGQRMIGAVFAVAGRAVGSAPPDVLRCTWHSPSPAKHGQGEPQVHGAHSARKDVVIRAKL